MGGRGRTKVAEHTHSRSANKQAVAIMGMEGILAVALPPAVGRGPNFKKPRIHSHRIHLGNTNTHLLTMHTHETPYPPCTAPVMSIPITAAAEGPKAKGLAVQGPPQTHGGQGGGSRRREGPGAGVGRGSAARGALDASCEGGRR